MTTPNLPAMSVSDSVLVHRSGTTGQQSIDKPAQQLNADLNIAEDRLAAEAAKAEAETARDKAQEWAEGDGEPGDLGARSAKGWADVAEQMRDDAETARDAAVVNADVYVDVPTGLAAVGNGDQFQVVDDVEIVRYRRDNASTATEVARYPSAAALLGVDAMVPEGADAPPGWWKTDEIVEGSLGDKEVISSWSPRYLFAGGEGGVFLDPGVGVFSDTGGTTVATADDNLRCWKSRVNGHRQLQLEVVYSCAVMAHIGLLKTRPVGCADLRFSNYSRDW